MERALAETIRQFRELLRLSHRGLAVRSNLSEFYLRQVERGECPLTIGGLAMVAHGLGCDPLELVANARVLKATRDVSLRAGMPPRPPEPPRRIA